MAYWLSVWNESTRAENSEWLAGKRLGPLWVPYSGSEISRGDIIYIVGIENGELLLLTRVVVGGITVDADGEWGDIDPEPGTEVEVFYDRVLETAITDQLVFASRQGGTLSIKRDRGQVMSQQFQGISSVREVLNGGKLLDRATGKP